MCLLGALSHPSDRALGAQLAGWASSLGGSALALDGAAGAVPGVSAAPLTANPLGGTSSAAASSMGQAIRLPTPRFSGRHGGITRVLSRLLAPLYAAPLVVDVPTAAAADMQRSLLLGAGSKPPIRRPASPRSTWKRSSRRRNRTRRARARPPKLFGKLFGSKGKPDNRLCVKYGVPCAGK